MMCRQSLENDVDTKSKEREKLREEIIAKQKEYQEKAQKQQGEGQAEQAEEVAAQ